jgi:hypothetical protein
MGGDVEWPAADATIFAVAAAGPDHALCEFSGRGVGVSLAAPGCGLELADPSTGVPISFAGTSPAGAFTSALLAALRSYRPDLSADQAEHVLRAATTDGVLNAEAALRDAGVGPQVDAASAQVPGISAGPSGTRAATTPTEPPFREASVPWRREMRINDSQLRWPRPRAHMTSCVPGAAVVRIENRPPAARVIVRLYARRGEFGSHLVSQRRERRSNVHLKRRFGYVTVQFAGAGRDASSALRLSGCGRPG